MGVWEKGYLFMLLTSVVLTLAAVGTLIPCPAASKECMLGYAAYCTFAPVSTILCLLITAAVCKARKRRYYVQSRDQ